MDFLRSMIERIKNMYLPVAQSGVSYAGNYTINTLSDPFVTVCYNDKQDIDYSFWKTIDRSDSNYPYLAIQIGVMILVTNLIHFLLKPLRQPRFISGILGGLIADPSLLGTHPLISTNMNLYQAHLVPETMANLCIVFYVFLVGLEIDMAALKLILKVNIFNASMGVVIPLAFGAITYHLLILEWEHKSLTSCAWWSVTLMATSFPELVQILSEFKLLHTEIGRSALTASLVNHVASWVLLIITVTTRFNPFMLISSISFMLLWWFVVRHFVHWAIENTCSDDGRYNDVQVYFAIMGMMLSGFISETCGSQAYLGIFIYALIIPKGEFGVKVVEKIEDLIGVVLLPLFFMVNGNRVVLNSLYNQVKVPALIASLAMASTCKILTFFIISVADGKTVLDSVILGALSNTKGIFGLILINTARNVGVFNSQLFTQSLVLIVLMASTVKPIMFVARRFKKPVKQYDYLGKTGEEIKSKFTEFRVLAGIPSSQYLPGIVKLLELSNPTEQSPLHVFSAHLIELREGSAATMLILDDAFETHVPHITHQKAESENISDTWEKYRLQTNEYVSVQQLQVTSDYDTMHEDVCSLVEEHGINMILLPFHKYSNVHGVLRCENACLRDVNRNILATARCTVAVLIDRSLSSSTCFRFETKATYNLAMIFIGGPDDREALAYAYRIARSKNVRLCVLRFLPTTDNEKDQVSDSNTEESSVLTEEKLERMIDDEYAKDFISKTANSRSITFMEARIVSTEQIFTTIRTLFHNFDLLIMGKGERKASALTAGLASEWDECDELGQLADTLVGSEFAKRISILVVRHYHDPNTSKLAKSSKQDEVHKKKKKTRFSMFDRL